MKSQWPKTAGQAVLEALLLAPLLCAFMFGLISIVFLMGAAFILTDRLDESLLCHTYRPSEQCQKDLQDFIRTSGLYQLSIQARFQKTARHWRGQIEIPRHKGSMIFLKREVPMNLSEGLR